MRTCVIETKGAGAELIRFTEVKCFFDYQNRWLGFFDQIVLLESADQFVGDSWKIRAGQYITSTIRSVYKDSQSVDLRGDDRTINFNEPFCTKRFMPRYRGLKQQYILENHMRMLLKQKKRLMYLGNNQAVPQLQAGGKAIWVPASGMMAYWIWRTNKKSPIKIYDINPQQLSFSCWLNSQDRIPTPDAVSAYVGKLYRASIAEPYFYDKADEGCWAEWTRSSKSYHGLDILSQDIPRGDLLWPSNILKYMPCYHNWGAEHIVDWFQRNCDKIHGAGPGTWKLK